MSDTDNSVHSSTHSPSLAFDLPQLGYGVGLRQAHYQTIMTEQPEIAWFEAISENFIDSQGFARHALQQIAQQYPMVLHGVSLSIGSTDPLDFDYLGKIKQLAHETDAQWISDHVCWTGLNGINSHDLLPVALTEEALQHIITRIRQVQDFLERPLILENPSSYVSYQCDAMTEWQFLNQMAEEADCGLLLDINNVYVSAFNHEFDAQDYLRNIAEERVVQIHLAGHTHCGSHIIDTHDRAVADPVWQLFHQFVQHAGTRPTLLEWDSHIPDFATLHQELNKAESVAAQLEFVSPNINISINNDNINNNADTSSANSHDLDAAPSISNPLAEHFFNYNVNNDVKNNLNNNLNNSFNHDRLSLKTES